MNTQTLALGFLAATAIGGVAWVFVYPMLSGEKQAESRRAVRCCAPERRAAPPYPVVSPSAAHPTGADR